MIRKLSSTIKIFEEQKQFLDTKYYPLAMYSSAYKSVVDRFMDNQCLVETFHKKEWPFDKVSALVKVNNLVYDDDLNYIGLTILTENKITVDELSVAVTKMIEIVKVVRDDYIESAISSDQSLVVTKEARLIIVDMTIESLSKAMNQFMAGYNYLGITKDQFRDITITLVAALEKAQVIIETIGDGEYSVELNTKPEDHFSKAEISSMLSASYQTTIKAITSLRQKIDTSQLENN